MVQLFVFPLKVLCGNPNGVILMVLRGEAFERCSLYKEISVLTKSPSHSCLHPLGPEKRSSLWTREEVSSDSTMDFTAAGPVRNQGALFISHPVPGVLFLPPHELRQRCSGICLEYSTGLSVSLEG